MGKDGVLGSIFFRRKISESEFVDVKKTHCMERGRFTEMISMSSQADQTDISI